MSSIVVLGASPNPRRFSYRTVLKLQQKNYKVIALGLHEGVIGTVAINTQKPKVEDIDSLLLYLNPLHQKECYEYILSLKPRRIIFSPGSENTDLTKMAASRNIIVLEDCALNMLCLNIF